jgi:hypothetical protein
MTFTYHCNINISGIRNCKLLLFNNNFILIGSMVYKTTDNIKKYLLNSFILNTNFELLLNAQNILDFTKIETDYFEDIYISSWIRDFYNINYEYYMLIEIKKNINNNYFESTHYLLTTMDFINFNILKKYDVKDFLFKDYNNILFTSKIENNDKFIWGTYLFSFIIKNKCIIPSFDSIVDYKNDCGHVLHNIEVKNKSNKYKIFFSIRHRIINNDYQYKIYTAKSNNLINFTNVQELNIELQNLNTQWLCYPFKFKFNDVQYIICNQDDYGKYKNPVILKKSK